MNVKINTNKKIIIIGIVLIALAFYGGMTYGKSMSGAARVARTGAYPGGFTGGARGAGARAGGGIVTGNIISSDATSITVGMTGGGSKIVLISDGTSVMKTVSGTSADLSVGKMVTANGTANSDGSISATMVSIRQATTTKQ